MASKNSPDETPEDLLAQLVAEHGPEIGAVAYRAMTGDLELPTASKNRGIERRRRVIARGKSAAPHTHTQRR